MQDSLFSPLRGPSGPAGPRVEGVSRVVNYIQRIIAENKTLATLRVRGEVSELNRSPAGHLYFNLKENADILKCIVWASNAEDLAPFKNGDEVIVAGEFGTYAQRSVYQLYVAELEHTGIGKLYAQFEALKEKFRREGLFESARKRPMPSFPQRIALVSAAGKGAEDFLKTIGKRAPQITVEFVETRVQGDGAEIEIADAIDR
ncbi:MAG: exodeoxyribonuclease VII large subunit, partial [Candidatus Eremiobacteraeota bacterium]|nr:exodeoxyribonuclease VII large subunit [Candidatus Eremiobacteraeota bacterium]